MLKALAIENIALVESLQLEFGKGLTALTGETGAGKSIIVTALSLSLGERADKEYIRHGATSATVIATFDIRECQSYLSAEVQELITDGILEIHRELNVDGASKVKINGKNVSLNIVKQITGVLAEIVGQHANQMLMNEENHLVFLDRFAGLKSQREALSVIFADWQKVAIELRQVSKRREQLHNERELLLFQKKEIEKATLRVGEEEYLRNERRILDSVRSLMESATSIENILDSEDVSVANLLSQAQKDLDSMAAVDTTLQKQQELLTELGYQVEELRRFIQQYGAGLQDDPQRLEEVNLRLDEIYELKKKYGGSEDAVLKTLEDITQRLKDRPDIDQFIADLEKQERSLRDKYTKEAATLSEARTDAAKSLNKLVMSESKKLAIVDCKFECEFLYEEDADGISLNGRSVKPFPHGLENGRFLFAANPGSPLRSLVKTASGGEMSRILLALKSAERETGHLAHSLLVFDEVDAGIGGRTAMEVGKKLKEMANDCQVLVITHLHQIARQADWHLVAEKTTDRKKKTVITVRPLLKTEIPQELERMIALPQTKQA